MFELMANITMNTNTFGESHPGHALPKIEAWSTYGNAVGARRVREAQHKPSIAHIAQGIIEVYAPASRVIPIMSSVQFHK
jgi:hypothetical protein